MMTVELAVPGSAVILSTELVAVASLMVRVLVAVPVLFAASLAVTTRVCEPAPVTTTGAVYGMGAPPSRVYVVEVTPTLSVAVAVAVTDPMYGLPAPADRVPTRA